MAEQFNNHLCAGKNKIIMKSAKLSGWKKRPADIVGWPSFGQ